MIKETVPNNKKSSNRIDKHDETQQPVVLDDHNMQRSSSLPKKVAGSDNNGADKNSACAAGRKQCPVEDDAVLVSDGSDEESRAPTRSSRSSVGRKQNDCNRTQIGKKQRDGRAIGVFNNVTLFSQLP